MKYELHIALAAELTRLDISFHAVCFVLHFAYAYMKFSKNGLSSLT